VRRQNGDFGAATAALSSAPLSFSTARLDGGHAAVVWNAASRHLFASFDDDLLADAP